ncbi:hypothetical protein M422DRAFT_243868 [Sphaerobolus stellatus SS14]|nr:hypothetical protein M422DRAFT_243868 [Sphaerobolus stellatus SS14]
MLAFPTQWHTPLESIAKNIQHLHATLSLDIAAIIAMIYDHFITFDQEVTLKFRYKFNALTQKCRSAEYGDDL